MRGKQSEPKKVEEVKALYAENANYSETARKANIPLSTAYQIIKTSDDFEELRNQVRLVFIKQGFEPMMKTLELTTQKVDELQNLPNLKLIDLKELTGALKDLKTSMENVGSTINVIGTQNNTQNNINLDTKQSVKAEILSLIDGSDTSNLSVFGISEGEIEEAIKRRV